MSMFTAKGKVFLPDSEADIDLRHIQEILGHKSSNITEIYTHVSNRDIRKVKSPLDNLNLNQKRG